MCDVFKLEINYDNLGEDSQPNIKQKKHYILNGKHRLTHRHLGQHTPIKYIVI